MVSINDPGSLRQVYAEIYGHAPRIAVAITDGASFRPMRRRRALPSQARERPPQPDV
jgi:hypothetical protein